MEVSDSVGSKFLISMTRKRCDSMPREPLTLCLDDSPVLGGLSRGIRDMADALGGKIVSLDSGRLQPSHDDAHWNIRRLDVGRGLLVSRHLRLRKQVADALDAAIAQSSLVACHSLYRAHLPFVRRSCLRHGVRYWVVAHGMLDPWVVSRHGGWKRAWLKLTGMRCLADADRVIFSTGAERAKASPWCRSGNTLVIPWPVDLPDVSDRAGCRAELRSQLAIPHTDRILLWLSRYDSLKRPLHTIAAFAAARQPGWHLVMAGYDGDLTREDVERTTRNKGENVIRILGPVEGEVKRRLLLASDAFVSLSWRENFGYSLADAAAYGLCGAYAPDHDLVADMPEQSRRWVARDHSLRESMRVIQEICTANSATRDASGHESKVWAKNRLARRRFHQVVRQEAASRLRAY